MNKYLVLATFLACGTLASPAIAQDFSPIRLAQANPTIIPTDATPTGIGEEREMFTPGWTYYKLQKLPPKMWISHTTECTQRLETNVFFTNQKNQADYVFRIQPNTTVGYNFLPHTSAYVNYFFIKDVFATHGILSRPNFMSLAGGLRQEVPIGQKTNLQIDFQVRELWQAQNLHQSDLLPGLTLTHVLTPKFILFGNTQLQMRSRNPFQGAQREIDPFFTVGGLYRHKDWLFTVTNTYVANFRNQSAIPPQSNMAMITDIEAARLINKKMPGLYSFVRAEPIWNWYSNSRPGLSGFDFRLFTGIRYVFNKPSIYAQMNNMKKQIQQSSDPYQPSSNKTKASLPAKPQAEPKSDLTNTIPDSPAVSVAPEQEETPITETAPQPVAESAGSNI
jgi:hypothetical protein